MLVPITIEVRGLPTIDDLLLGMQRGRDAEAFVPVDGGTPRWTIEIERVHREGEPDDFRGAHVQGQNGDRFLYLTWVRRSDHVGIGRSKLMLNDAPAGEALHLSVDVSGARGYRTGAIRPPAAVWTAAPKS